jgi:2-polyprenyl-6-methoxyphenol hydroxylase-like FAD-dependent oxidoreductase
LTNTASGIPDSAGSHAIVIGGSMAGLWAGRVLADHFDRVTIIERDHFPPEPDFRNGVPQGRHLHIFLARGQQILDHLFPGLNDELLAAGAVALDWAEDVLFLVRSGWTMRYRSDIIFYTTSRVLLEHIIRQRLSSNPKVRFVQGAEVTDLVTNEAKTHVTGVRVRYRPGAEGAGDTLTADLIVDASGRNSNTPDWLQGMGYQRPQDTVINSFLGYATRWYQRPPNFQSVWKLLVINPRPPQIARGGGILPAEGDRWVVTLGGAARDYPPTDEAGFMEFARSLVSPMLYDAIKDAEPLTPIYGYQRTANQFRHFERLERWPENFVVTGDAVCAFNPIYGQGMTVAAMDAMTLDETLRGGRGAGMAQRFQRRLAEVNETPWLLATGEDFRYPTTEGGQRTPRTRFSHWYLDKVLLAMPGDQRIADTFLRVIQLTTPPTALFQPHIMRKVLEQAIRFRKVSFAESIKLPPHWQIEQKVSTF